MEINLVKGKLFKLGIYVLYKVNAMHHCLRPCKPVFPPSSHQKIYTDHSWSYRTIFMTI